MPIFVRQMEYLIHAPLEKCIDFIQHVEGIDRSPKVLNLVNPQHKYAIMQQYQILPTTYNYSIVRFRKWSFINGYQYELGAKLSAIDDSNTQLICASGISTSFIMGCIIASIFSLIIAGSFSLLSLLVPVGCCYEVYVAFQSTQELIEFHHKLWLMMPTRS